MSKKRSYVLVLFFLMLFSVSFSHNVFAYGPDYPVAEKPSLTDRVLSGVENITSIYSGTVKNQKAAFISSLRDTVLDFLGFTNEEPSLLPPPTTAPANSANPENSTKTFPNYVTNNYITNTYPSTIIKGGGGSTSGLARSVSRTNSIQDDTLTSLQNQIDGLPLGDIFSTSTTRGVLSASSTGLSYATSTGIFSLSSGYEIPLSASTTAWNTFYTTPSSRITAGTNLSWSSNTLNVSTTPTFASTTLSNFTAGSIPFFGTGGSLNQNNGNLFWDNTNARLGIGTTTPSAKLSITGGGTSTGRAFTIANSSNVDKFTVLDNGDVTLSTMTSGSALFAGTSGIISQDNANFFWDNSNKRLGLGTNAPLYQFSLYRTVPGTTPTYTYSDQAGIQFTAPADNSYIRTMDFVVGGGGQGSVMRFFTAGVGGATAATNKMTIDSTGVQFTGLTDGSVLFSNSSRLTQNNANLFWDNTNYRLSVKNTSPVYDYSSYRGVPATTPTYASNDYAGFSFNAPNDAGNVRMMDIVAGSGNTGSVMRFFTGLSSAASLEHMRITSAGNIGIGTTTPVGRLSIIPTSNTSTALYIKGLASQSGNVIDYRNSANTSLLNFDPSTNGNAGMMTLNYLKAEGAAYISDIGAHNAANNLTIGPTDANGYSLIFRTNNQEKARFTSSGNFGIGTTTPTAKLQVVSTTEQQRIGYNSSNYFTTTVGVTGIATFNAVGSGASFSFSDKTTVTDGSRTVIIADSTYAIDATAPNNGTVARFTTSYGGQPMVAVLGDPSVGAGHFTDDGGSDVAIATGALAIDAVGDINTTGDVCSTNYCLEAVGASDSRLKKNIETLDDGDTTILNKVLSLNPVSYEWNDTYNETYRPQSDPVQLGFVAQDIKEIFPELVSENKDGYMIVKYNQLTAVIVRAIQELNTKVDNLVASLADKVVTMKEAIVGKLRIEGDVCVDDVCVTKEQFKSLLQNAGGTNPPEEPQDDVVVDPVIDPVVDPVVDDVTEDEEDDAVVPPEPEAEIEPIIEPEAEPEAEPVVEPASNEAPTPDEISL